MLFYININRHIFIYQNFLWIKLKYSRGRYFHTAWTPPSPWNSIVIFGGTDGSGSNIAELTAEVVQSEGDVDFAFCPSLQNLEKAVCVPK